MPQGAPDGERLSVRDGAFRKGHTLSPKTHEIPGIPSLIEVCKVKGCGRKEYARGYCQTHHRQFLKTGKVTAIRPYRERHPGTEKFAGLRLKKLLVDTLKALAKEKGLSNGATIAYVLEEWNENGHPWPLRKSRR